MIVTADEVNRSVRGTLELLNRRVEGLKAFDMSEDGFWRSFAAIWLTLPAYVVSLAFERARLGLDNGHLLDHPGLDVAVAAAHLASFVALPLAMIWIARRFDLTRAYVPFVIVTNWISAMGLLVLSVPAMLLLLGWATPPLASVFSLAFAVVIVRMQWFAAKATLGISSLPAFGLVLLGILLNSCVGSLTRTLLG